VAANNLADAAGAQLCLNLAFFLPAQYAFLFFIFIPPLYTKNIEL
jgi:hypothetical protein